MDLGLKDKAYRSGMKMEASNIKKQINRPRILAGLKKEDPVSKKEAEEKALSAGAKDKDIQAVYEKAEKECLSVSVKEVDGKFNCGLIAARVKQVVAFVVICCNFAAQPPS